MNQLDFSAIFWGLVVALGLGFAMGIFLAVATGVHIAADEQAHTPEMTDEEFARYYLENIPETRFFLALVLALLAVNGLAGYVTASLAQGGVWRNVFVAGGASLAITLAAEMRNPVLPRWAEWLWGACALPAALAGAWIAVG